MMVMAVSIVAMLYGSSAGNNIIFGAGALLGMSSVWWAFYMAGKWKC